MFGRSVGERAPVGMRYSPGSLSRELAPPERKLLADLPRAAGAVGGVVLDDVGRAQVAEDVLLDSPAGFPERLEGQLGEGFPATAAAALPRISSSASAFFFCGIIELDVQYASCSSIRPNSDVE